MDVQIRYMLGESQRGYSDVSTISFSCIRATYDLLPASVHLHPLAAEAHSRRFSAHI